MKYFRFIIWNILDWHLTYFEKFENRNISDLPHEMQGWHKAPFGASHRLHRKWFVDSFPQSLKYLKYLKYLKMQLTLFPDLCTDCNQIRIAVNNVLLPLIFLYFIHILWCSTQIKSKKIKNGEGTLCKFLQVSSVCSVLSTV